MNIKKKRKKQQKNKHKNSTSSKEIVGKIELETDYDKLAEAIIKAQKKASETKETEENTKGKKNLFVNILRILRGDKSKDGRLLAAPFIFLIQCIFRMTTIIGVLLMILFDVGFVKYLISSQWQGIVIFTNILLILFVILASAAVLLFMVLFWGAANDVEREKDYNYVVSVFSGLVSLAALIVAIIALHKGVG